MGQLLPKNIDLIVFSYSRRFGQAAHAAPSEQQRTAYAEATVGGWIAAEKQEKWFFVNKNHPRVAGRSSSLRTGLAAPQLSALDAWYTAAAICHAGTGQGGLFRSVF